MTPVLWLLGCRRVTADAENATALLELCRACSFTFAGFFSDAEGGIGFFCPLRTARRLALMAEAGGIRITLSGGMGVPPFVWRQRRRVGLWLGGLCAAFLMLLSTRYVWDVRVTGNELFSEAEILSELSACGFGVGSYLPGLRVGELENRVLMQADGLAWISINMDGTVARVQVIEQVEAPSTEPKRPANLVARADGQIEGLELFRGEAVVQIGQPVRAGELLVSGITDSSTEGYRYTRAAGRVLARTERVFRVEVPLSEQVKSPAGRKKVSVWLNFFQKSVKIFKSTGNEVGACDIIEVEKQIPGFLPYDLPISVTTKWRQEYETATVERTQEEALELAYLRLSRELGALSPDVQLIRKELETELSDGSVVLICRVTCIENIAEQVEFEVEEIP